MVIFILTEKKSRDRKSNRILNVKRGLDGSGLTGYIRKMTVLFWPLFLIALGAQ
jgi:hypothetical protein